MNRRGICENKQKAILTAPGEGEGEVVRESGQVVMVVGKRSSASKDWASGKRGKPRETGWL